MKNTGVYCPLIFLAAIFFLVGISSTTLLADEPSESQIKIPVLPDFKPALQLDGTPYFISIDALKEGFTQYSPKIKSFVYGYKLEQTTIILPDPSWIKIVLDSFKELLFEVGVKAEADTWDCENYSSLLSALTTLEIWKLGYLDTKAAIGWLRVDAHKSWAGIPAEMHALIFTATLDGIYIIEPQNGRYISLAEYPNRQFIEEVYLF